MCYLLGVLETGCGLIFRACTSMKTRRSSKFFKSAPMVSPLCLKDMVSEGTMGAELHKSMSIYSFCLATRLLAQHFECLQGSWPVIFIVF